MKFAYCEKRTRKSCKYQISSSLWRWVLVITKIVKHFSEFSGIYMMQSREWNLNAAKNDWQKLTRMRPVFVCVVEYWSLQRQLNAFVNSFRYVMQTWVKLEYSEKRTRKTCREIRSVFICVVEYLSLQRYLKTSVSFSGTWCKAERKNLNTAKNARGKLVRKLKHRLFVSLSTYYKDI